MYCRIIVVRGRAMSQFRIPTKNSKYYVPKETYLTAVHFCKQYPIWTAELAMTPNPVQGVSYDRDVVQTSGQGDATAMLAIRRAEMARKKKLVDDTAQHVGGDKYASWILQGVCFNLAWYQLEQRGIPCGRDVYYSMRRRFYYELSTRI